MTGMELLLAISQLDGRFDGLKFISMDLEVFANLMNVKPDQVAIEW